MSTETIEKIEIKPGDPSLDGGTRKYAHYVDKEKVGDAYVFGTPMIALCGYAWVPSRDPKNYPVCPECERLFKLGPEGRLKELQNRGE